MNDGAEWLTLIAGALPVALYAADIDANLTGPRTVSESLAASLGYRAADFTNRADLWMSRVHPADLTELRARVSAIAATGAFSL